MADDEENDDALPSLEKLLGHAGEAQESPYAVSIFNHSHRRAEGAVEHPIPKDCNNAPAPEVERNENERGETDSCSNSHQSSNGSISVKQGVQHGSLNTPTTSVPGSEARYDP
jgi:hypothetical protein